MFTFGTENERNPINASADAICAKLNDVVVTCGMFHHMWLPICLVVPKFG